MATIAYLNSAARMYLRQARERAATAEERLRSKELAAANLWLGMARESLAIGLKQAHDPSRPFPALSTQHDRGTAAAGGAQ